MRTGRQGGKGAAGVLFIVGLMLCAPLTSADHLQGYENNPVDHDELGRSNEPDGEATPPGMFAFQVAQAVIDLDLDHYADVPTPPGLPGHDPVIAPGCTDEAGNRLTSGQCGLYTVFGGDVPPVSGVVVDRGSCPGRHADAPMIFLDARADLALATGGSPTWGSPLGHPVPVPLNQKVQDLDTQLGGFLTAVGLHPPVAGTMMVWAWFGLWQDKNCNGVIDHLAVDNAIRARSDNEFVWLGTCRTETGSFGASAVLGGLCIQDFNPNSDPAGTHRDAQTTMGMWIWPGAYDVANLPNPLTSPGIPSLSDAVGSVLDGVGTEDIPPLPTVPPEMPAPLDPSVSDLLHQDRGLRPDAFGLDTTGAGVTEDRLWMFGGLDGVGWFYDGSLFQTTWIVTGVNCRPAPGGEQAFEVGITGAPGSACTFLDVDRYRAVSPLVGSLVQWIHGKVARMEA